MRKLVLTVLALIALFSALRAYTESLPAPSFGFQLRPGLVVIGEGSSSVELAFGAMEKPGPQAGLWNLLPLRIVYRNGDRSVSIGLNGLSFLLRGGVSVGTPVNVTAARTGDVISVGGRITVDARVEGDIWALGADVVLTPRAAVTGNVVALGGKVAADPKAVVKGSVSQLPEVKIPFLGVLGTQFSVQAVDLGRHALGYLLFGIVLLFASFYLSAHVRGMYRSLPATWRSSLITVAVALVVVPLLMVLLVASVIGVLFLPLVVFALALAALFGFAVLCARLGGLLRGGRVEGAGNDSLFHFTSGLLGLFLVKAPAVVGVLLTLVRSTAAARAGQVLQLVTFALFAAGLLYGFGASLAYARVRAAK
jgi:hypothetical protein